LRPGGDNDSDEVANRQSTASHELSPRPTTRKCSQKSAETGDDKQKMAGNGDHCDQQVRSMELPCLKQNCELLEPSLKERRNEQVDVVPKQGNYASCAEPHGLIFRVSTMTAI